MDHYTVGGGGGGGLYPLLLLQCIRVVLVEKVEGREVGHYLKGRMCLQIIEM